MVTLSAPGGKLDSVKMEEDAIGQNYTERAQGWFETSSATWQWWQDALYVRTHQGFAIIEEFAKVQDADFFNLRRPGRRVGVFLHKKVDQR